MAKTTIWRRLVIGSIVLFPMGFILWLVGLFYFPVIDQVQRQILNLGFLISIAITLLLFWLLAKRFPQLNQRKGLKFGMGCWYGMLLLPSIIGALLISNGLGHTALSYNYQLLVTDKQEFDDVIDGRTITSQFIIIDSFREDETLSLLVGRELPDNAWDKLAVGDTIYVTITRGRWDWPWLTEVRIE